jgi:phosphoribosylformylglycinamidine cyclo-ligase
LGPWRVQAGDVLLGIASSGLHTNGYSLARKVLLEKAGLALSEPFPGGNASVAEELLKVHRCYLQLLEPLLDHESLHAMAHITGGGITENLPRVLPDSLSATIRLGSWPVLNVFQTLRGLGDISDQEMYRVFNMGIGMILVVAPDRAAELTAQLKEGGEQVYRLGEVVAGRGDVRYIAS